MFKYVTFFALIAFAAAAVPSDDAHAEVKTLIADVRPDGYSYEVETSNSIRAEQAGDEHGNVHGVYEHLTPEGVHVKVEYVADENGYQPKSDLLPTPPPVPAYILKAIEYIRTHPPQPTDPHKH